ncbi:hypothetical protein FTUN_8006 [Frigoriglobus tundricola]|uniref:ArnT-like N-terminal domain-containing protein n=1 Tax=Frigoriglobus tundricola TaxID=2774151 RepID=A0A6M5Z3N9_9BACT|nr:hypothetical protein FTUN_8006 [Frigoriglobus tundricola]
MTGSRWLILAAVLALAAAPRFARLGAWPFAGDEVATLAEADAFSQGDTSDTPIARLPRAIPLAHTIHSAAHAVFGRDEFGARVAMALFGTATVGLAFLLLDRPGGRPRAVATAVLIALWPEHVFHSQYVRFYTPATFFGYAALLCGAVAIDRWSAKWMWAAAGAVLAATLCHTVTAALTGVIGVGTLAAGRACRCSPVRLLVPLCVAAVSLGVFYVIYLRPLLAGWNSDAQWGYTSTRALLSAVNMLSWPVALLGGAGFVLLAADRTRENWYWVTVALGWLGAAAVLPRVIAFHPAYVVPFALGALVPAGHAVGRIYTALRPSGALPAWVCSALACCGSLPSLLSHELDGSRPDLRTATQYVAANRRPGDRVVAAEADVVTYYLNSPEVVIGVTGPDIAGRLAELAKAPGRMWIILPSGRAGLPPPLIAWLGRNCAHELRARKTRFDYLDYCVDVYLYSGGTKPSLLPDP